MATRRRFLVLIGAGGCLSAAAAIGIVLLPSDGTSSGFPRIRYGKEACAYCGMSIDDPRFAAAWREPGGSEEHFDDIGCMVNASRHNRPETATRFYVHDFNDEAWLDAATASYVVAPAIKTPMAYGLVAISSPEAAGSLASEKRGLVYDWSGLVTNLEKKG